MHVKATFDYETSDRAGAAGTFQVTELIDMATDKDITSLVDQGYHYHDINELKADLAKALKLDATAITIEVE